MLAALLALALDERLDKALALLNEQRFADARPLLEANAADHPQDPTALGWLAYAQVSLGDADAALATTTKAIEIAPTVGPLWYHRGRALLLRHEFADADAALKRSGELAADFFPAWRSHFQALAALGLGDEPRAHKLYAESPESKTPWADPAFLFERMASLYAVVPDPEPARTWYRRAATEYFVGANQRPPLVVPPPFHGSWLVSQGNHGDESHFGIAGSFGLDLGFLKHERLFEKDPPEGQPVAKEAYFSYDMPLVCPANARVERVVDGIPDNAATSSDRAPLADRAVQANPLGNHVVLRITDDGFLLLAHLRAGSIPVSVGDRLKRGDVVGRIGQSGLSYAPHLHLTALRQLDPPIGRPLRFSEALLRKPPTAPRSKEPVLPATGDVVIARN